MTILGWFEEETGRPKLYGHLWITRLGIGRTIPFLVDTGADRTTLMPNDAVLLGLDFSLLKETQDTYGVGGSAECYVERAIVIFDDQDKGWIAYQILVGIIKPESNYNAASLPSLLGRDILNYWRMNYDPIGRSLIFDI